MANAEQARNGGVPQLRLERDLQGLQIARLLGVAPEILGIERGGNYVYITPDEPPQDSTEDCSN